MRGLLTLVDEIKAIKLELAERYYGGVCYVCKKPKSKKGMTFHHKKYIANDVVHSSYPKNSSGTPALLYGSGTTDPKEPETVHISLLTTSPGSGTSLKVWRRDPEKFISMC